MMTWKNLTDNAYTPYSATPKACVVKGSGGTLFAGVRIESISFPTTIPALQAACCICLSEGEQPVEVYAPDSDLEHLDFWLKEFDLILNQQDTPPEGTYFNPFRADESNPERLALLLDKAVTPHSDFQVSCILTTKSGTVEGVNIEESAWTMGLCAERVAIAKAISAGEREFIKMSVHTRTGSFSSPCGACRQVITEHMPLHSIELFHPNETESVHLSADLLPFSFTSKALKKQ